MGRLGIASIPSNGIKFHMTTHEPAGHRHDAQDGFGVLMFMGCISLPWADCHCNLSAYFELRLDWTGEWLCAGELYSVCS